MGKFLQEFKQFAMRGNVVDMAVGIIIGGAFGKIVSSVVRRYYHACRRVTGGWCQLYRFENRAETGGYGRR